MLSSEKYEIRFKYICYLHNYMITDLNNKNYICYIHNNITTNLTYNNHLCYLQKNMRSNLNIFIIS